jgi:hypothetical protein
MNLVKKFKTFDATRNEWEWEILTLSTMSCCKCPIRTIQVFGSAVRVMDVGSVVEVTPECYAMSVLQISAVKCITPTILEITIWNLWNVAFSCEKIVRRWMSIDKMLN